MVRKETLAVAIHSHRLFSAASVERYIAELSQFNLTDDKVKKLKVAIGNRGNYEFFYYKEAEYDNKNKKLKITYYDTKEKIEEKKKVFNEKIQYVINAAIKSEYSDLQKELAIYRYITENTDYDFEGLKAGIPTNMYSIVIEWKGICFNYAYTMKYLLNKVGVEVHVVLSTSHAWNIVKIDGLYYHLDATAMKPNNMDLFNFTDREMTANWETPRSEIYFGNLNYKKLKTPDCNNDRFKFLREVGSYALDGKDFYYANAKDKLKLYKMNIDGSNKQKISDTSILSMVLVEDYIYYSGMNSGKHLYKIKKDGTDKKLLDDSMEVHEITVKDKKIHCINKKKNIGKQISLDAEK